MMPILIQLKNHMYNLFNDIKLKKTYSSDDIIEYIEKLNTLLDDIDKIHNVFIKHEKVTDIIYKKLAAKEYGDLFTEKEREIFDKYHDYFLNVSMPEISDATKYLSVRELLDLYRKEVVNLNVKLKQQENLNNKLVTMTDRLMKKNNIDLNDEIQDIKECDEAKIILEAI